MARKRPTIEDLARHAADLIVARLPRRTVERHLLRRARPKQLSATRLEAIIAAGGQLLRDQAAADAGLERQVALVRLDRLYRKCVTAGDHHTALAVQREISRLHETWPQAVEPDEADAEPAAGSAPMLKFGPQFSDSMTAARARADKP